MRGIQNARINALEVGHDDRIADGLIDARSDAEINAGDATIGRENESIGARSAVDRIFAAVIADGIVTGAGHDDVSTTIAVDRIGARASSDRVCRRGTRKRYALRDGERRSIDVFKVRGCSRVADRLVERSEVDGGRLLQDEGIGSRTAIEGGFRAVVGDGVVARAGCNHIGAAVAVDGVRTSTACDRVRGGRAGNRHAVDQRRCIDILEGDHTRQVTRGLINIGEIDRRVGLQHERIDARTARDGNFRAVIGDGIVTSACVDAVRTAAAVDCIGTGSGQDRIGVRRTSDGEGRGQRTGVDAFEIDDTDRVADRLIGAACNREVDSGDAARIRQHEGIAAGAAVDGGFRAFVVDRIVACACGDNVRPTGAIDGVRTRAAGNDVDAARAADRGRLARRETGRIDVLESADSGQVASRLIGRAEINGRRGFQNQGVRAAAGINREFGAPVVDRVIACTGHDDVGAATPMDRIRARTRRDRVCGGRSRHGQGCGQEACVDVLEIGDVDHVADGLVRARRDREVDTGNAAGSGKHEHVGARATVKRAFRGMVGDGIVTRACGDDVCATGAIDHVCARTAREHVGAARTNDGNARCKGACIDIFEIGHID